MRREKSNTLGRDRVTKRALHRKTEWAQVGRRAPK
jgi:hypothetical protein